MVLIEKIDAATGITSEIEIHPGDRLTVVVADDRALERDRAAFTEFSRVTGSRVTIQTTHERNATRKSEPEYSPADIRVLTAALDGEDPE